jgi:ATP-dependent protease ClpP protease subunit
MTNFIYTINPGSENPTMLINKAIGEEGIMGSQFQEEIFSLVEMGAKRITVYINSVGGSVIEGMSIYNSIMNCGVPVDTCNVGVAASIASVIFLAGSKRYMYDYSVLMVHNPFNADGSEDKSLDVIRKSIITMISERSSLTPDEIGAMMDETTWIEAEDAKKMGLCDEVKSSSNTEKVETPEITKDIYAKWEMSDKILNKIILKNKNEKMKTELIKMLNEAGITISNEANEAEVYDVMKALLAKRNEDKVSEDEDEDEDKGTEKIKMKKKKNIYDPETHELDPANEMEGEDEDEDEDEDTMDDKYNELKKAYDSLVAEFTLVKKQMEDKKTKEMEDKVNSLINSAIKSGKIKESSIDMCKTMAKVDFSTFEKFINDLPVNKKAVKIEAIDNKINDERLIGYKPDAASMEMARIANKLK